MSATTIAFAPDVSLSLANLDPESIELLRAACLTAPDLVAETVYVTSAIDGLHTPESYHFVGRAWDLRILGTEPGKADRTGAIESPMQVEEGKRWAERIQKVRPEWQVFVHNKNHIHAERDVRAALGR